MTMDHRCFKQPGIKRCALCCVFLMGIITIIASGGGGGGGSSSTGTTTIITTYNAETIATNAYMQSKSAVDTGNGSVETIKSRETGDETGSNAPQALALTRQVLDFMERVGFTLPQARKSLSSLNSTTIDGTCGGQADILTSVDSIHQEFSLAAVFSNYCMNAGIVLNGMMDISGKIDLHSDRILSFEVSFSYFNTAQEDSGKSTTLSGIMSMALTDFDTISCVMDLSLTDDTTGKTYALDDFSVTLSGLRSNSLIFTMSGAFTDPDNGTFTLATTTPFIINKTDVMPCQGVMVVTANDNTKAELTIWSTTTYQVRADTNGDGTYNFDTGAKSW